MTLRAMSKPARIWVAIVVLAATLAQAAPPESRPTTQPAGIAARCPGDVGIAKNSAVIFHEDFETPKIDSEKWTRITKTPGVAKLTRRTLSVHRGRQSLELAATMGKDTGGSLFKMFDKGYEKLHTRFCVKFAEDIDWIHHFVRMTANNPPTAWPGGGAGRRPAGDRRFSVAIEPWGRWGMYPPPGGWRFYCYWWKMPISRDGNYWGRGFNNKKAYAVPEPGKWYCVEFMAQCNTPSEPDGQAALWIDGKKLCHQKNITWRSSDKLKLNGLNLMLYVTAREAKNSPPGKVNRVWFDDVVVATKYIGPPLTSMVKGPPTASQPAKPRRKPSQPAANPTYRLKQRVKDILKQHEQRPLPGN